MQGGTREAGCGVPRRSDPVQPGVVGNRRGQTRGEPVNPTSSLLNAAMALLLFVPTITCARDYLWVADQMRSRVPVPLRDDLSLKFALEGFVLQRHTPLAIRRAYVRSHVSGCVFLLLIALLVALNGAILPACLFGTMFLFAALSTLSKWRWTRDPP